MLEKLLFIKMKGLLFLCAATLNDPELFTLQYWKYHCNLNWGLCLHPFLHLPLLPFASGGACAGECAGRGGQGDLGVRRALAQASWSCSSHGCKSSAPEDPCLSSWEAGQSVPRGPEPEVVLWFR